MNVTPSRAKLGLVGCAVLFSIGGVLIKGMDQGPWQIAGMRSVLAALTLLILAPSVLRCRPNAALLTVAVAYSVALVAYVLANRYTTTLNVVALQATAPVHVIWIEAVRGRHWPKARDVLVATVILLSAAILLAYPQEQGATSTAPVLGNWLAFSSGGAWAIVLLGLRHLSTQGVGDPARGNVAGIAGLFYGNIIALVIAISVGGLPSSMTTPELQALFALGILQSGVANYGLSRFVPRVPAVEAGLLLLLEPVLGTLLTWHIHGEKPATRFLLAALAIFMAATYRLAGDWKPLTHLRTWISTRKVRQARLPQ